MFEHPFYPLEKVKTPSKAFFERIAHQIVTRFSVIGYKSVANRTQDDIDMPNTNLTLDPVSGSFRNTTQEYFTAIPSNSEAFRARMKTLGVGYFLGRLKHPMKMQLRTVHVETVVISTRSGCLGKNAGAWLSSTRAESQSPPHPFTTSCITTT